MIRTRALFVVVACVVALTASGSEVLGAEETSMTPEGVVWSLTGQATDGLMSAVPEGLGAWLGLESGEAAGDGGCNGFTGSYTLDGSSLAFDALEFSMRDPCSDDVAEIESTYGQNLLGTATWAVDAERLQLSGADGAVLLVFEASPQNAPLGTWAVIELTDGQGGMAGIPDSTYLSATFTSANKLRGFDGCNDYLAPYEVDGPTIAVGEIVTPAPLPCEDEPAERSAAYASALAAAATWSVDEDAAQLELLDAGGSTLIRFQRAR